MALLETTAGKALVTFFMAMLPVVELRGVESAEQQAEKRRLLELLGG